MDLEKAKIHFDRARGDWSNVNPPAPLNDNRHVYSATCSWNGPIANVGRNDDLPVCPHCGSVLFEQDTDDWNSAVAEYAEIKNDLVYPRFVEWLSTRGKCSPLATPNALNTLRSEFHDAHPG